MTGCHFLGYDQTNELPSKAQNKLLFREIGLDLVDVQNHSFSKSFVGFAFGIAMLPVKLCRPRKLHKYAFRNFLNTLIRAL